MGRVERLVVYSGADRAPLVFNDVWACWAVDNLMPLDRNPYVVTTRSDCKELDCVGPHRELITGEKVE